MNMSVSYSWSLFVTLTYMPIWVTKNSGVTLQNSWYAFVIMNCEKRYYDHIVNIENIVISIRRRMEDNESIFLTESPTFRIENDCLNTDMSITCNGKVEGVPVEMLVDTGSVFTLISKDLCDKSCKELPPRGRTRSWIWNKIKNSCVICTPILHYIFLLSPLTMEK